MYAILIGSAMVETAIPNKQKFSSFPFTADVLFHRS